MICVFKNKHLQGSIKNKRCMRCDGTDIRCIHYYNQVNPVDVPSGGNLEKKARPSWVSAAFDLSAQEIDIPRGQALYRVDAQNGFRKASESIVDDIISVFDSVPHANAAGEMGAPPRGRMGRKRT